jgi:hypothetical protein
MWLGSSLKEKAAGRLLPREARVLGQFACGAAESRLRAELPAPQNLCQKYNCPLVTGDPEFRSVDQLELDWIERD